MKNTKEIIFWTLVMVLASVFLVRFFTPEDDWICDRGQWIKHGNPAVEKPIYPCPQEIK